MSAVTLVPAPAIRLDTVLEIVRDTITAAEQINGTGATGHGAERRASEAANSRALLNLSDQLMLASTLVRNEYWNAKGETSYDL